ncbi:VanZ family protein [Vicingaceae bacterium]|nr:VanZ family protein [Vicingaceae bacterium]
MIFSKKNKLFLPAIFWLFIILFLSGYSGKQMPKIPVWQIDKFAHTFMYLILSVCMCIPFFIGFSEKNKRYTIGLKIVLFGILYGGLMEILQESIFINRSGNWYDFFANTLGAILGVIIFPIILKYLPINRLNKII